MPRPTAVTDQKRVISQQGKIYNLPQTLCVRKDVVEDLLDLFIGTASELDGLKAAITDVFDQFAATIGATVPGLQDFILSVGGRTGAMKVENHFFSTMKCVFLTESNLGFGITGPRIPANFADFVGAKTLMTKFHNWDSFVPGVRDPSDPNDTKARFIFEEIEMSFNIKSLSLVLSNPYFSILGGGVGKFTRVKWRYNKDKAIVDFWVPENWAINIEQSTI